MFWLAPLLSSPVKLFDFGGHCGTHFYAYAPYIDYSPELQWVVCDVPEIMQYGKQIAAEQGKKQLTFAEGFADADGADVLLAAGSLQYVESPNFSVSLASLKSLPRHLVLNKLPLYDGPTFVTLQNGGVAFHPMYVFNRKDFIDSICDWAIDWRINGQFRAMREEFPSIRRHLFLHIRVSISGLAAKPWIEIDWS